MNNEGLRSCVACTCVTTMKSGTKQIHTTQDTVSKNDTGTLICTKKLASKLSQSYHKPKHATLHNSINLVIQLLLI